VNFSARLLAWFRRHQRPLPWRKTKDPYRIWVSEIMLQQTRAAAVIPFYNRFLERFPDVTSLARSREQALLESWSGLGYYSRARNLRRAARQIVESGDGRFPRTAAAWAALPGVGPYTAAAVASIAFAEPVAVLDGNVVRVMARVANEPGDVRSTRVRDQLRHRAEELLDTRHPGEFNQALMELGATLCLPRRPQCLVCPVAQWCEARRLGRQEELPVKLGRATKVAVEISVAVVEKDGKLLLRRRPETESRMPGFWELPESGAPRLVRGEPLGRFRHAITFHQYTVTVHPARLRGARPAGYRWVSRGELAQLPLTTITRKALKLAGP